VNILGAAGSGKSYIMNMIPLRYVDCPNFRGIVFRRETTQLTGEGGMWDTATEIYSKLPKDIRPKVLKHNLRMIFPNGAKIKFSHMENDNDFRKHQGLISSPLCW
jgi:hypothetical protein